MSSHLSWAGVLTALALAAPLAAQAADGVVIDKPEVMVRRQGLDETVALPAGAYSDFACDETGCHFVLQNSALPAGSVHVLGRGIERVRWQPQGEAATRVDVEFATPPTSSLINAVPGTQQRPQTAQVIAGFTFDAAAQKPAHHPVVGSRNRQDSGAESADEYGSYTLPRLKPVRYSDALVTLELQNADFREVLWLLSQIGNVSIVLDPYWADEPTGNRRPIVGGGDGAGGGPGPGQSGGGGVLPTPPRQGVGNLTLSFKEVPFDQALDLVVMTAGLVKVDIWPGS